MEEDDHEEFHDFTVRSDLERFTASIEQTLSSWTSSGMIRSPTPPTPSPNHLPAALDSAVPCTSPTTTLHAGLDALRRKPRGSGLVRLRAALHHRLPFRRGTPYLLTLHLPPLPELPVALDGVAAGSSDEAAASHLDERDADTSEDGEDAAPVVEMNAGAV
jgi:hypothetical protein